jgi:amino acid transporter
VSKRSTTLRFKQTRKVSGFTRPMSVFDAFVYNFLAMGVIFPWTYLWGPASFLGSNVELGIWLAFLAQIPISLAYCFLGTVLPVTGGDYAFQTRAFGKWGFIIVMSGFVIWILQWIALSGWLLSTLGIAPLMLVIGVIAHSPKLSVWAIDVQRPMGVFVISFGLALFTAWFLNHGLRLYVRVQRFLFYATLLSIFVVIYVFVAHHATLNADLNRFIQDLSAQGVATMPPQMAGDFVGFIQSDVQSSGFRIVSAFSFFATLGLVPIAWTSFQWSTYSAEQNAEIAEADRFWPQFLILIGSAFLVALCLAGVAHFEHEALSKSFMTAVSAAYWLQKASPETVGFVKGVLQPFPNVLAMAGSRNIIVAILIAIGFISNSFQVTCNSFIGVSRILVAMSNDGVLPSYLQLDIIDPRSHAPVRANWFYFALSIPWIMAYNFIPNWATYSLGVTFGCGYVFAFSALAATRIPTKMREFLQTSTIHSWNPRWMVATGAAGFVIAISMVISYLLLPQLGLTGVVPNIIVLCIIAAAYVVYQIATWKSDLVAKAFDTKPHDAISSERDR